MSPRRGDGRLYLGFALLFALHFYVRPRIFDGRAAPDFLFLALMLVAIRARPGYAALAGFVFGMVSDALTPAALGSGALANTVVGYLAAWGRAVFFPDNVLVNAGLFAAGLWVRNAIILLASGTPSAQLSSGLLVWAPLSALSSAVAGMVLLMMLRDWFAIRLEA
ncbi:MAG TPA: rod shape-determining protein MreD [Gemmatimonadales bacterium]|nr:rod shape-determining protein MreD [Gemmatimonadales bacterium]